MINMNIANPRACVIGGRAMKQVEKFKYAFVYGWIVKSGVSG